MAKQFSFNHYLYLYITCNIQLSFNNWKSN